MQGDDADMVDALLGGPCGENKADSGMQSSIPLSS